MFASMFGCCILLTPKPQNPNSHKLQAFNLLLFDSFHRLLLWFVSMHPKVKIRLSLSHIESPPALVYLV